MGEVYRFGNIEVRPEERELRVGGERVALGARAFDLLLALIERRGRVVAKGELIEAVWRDSFVEEGNLAAQVVALRRALGADAIATVPGRGYQFTLRLDDLAAVSEPQPPAAHFNLPAALDSLVGRDAELCVIGEMIRDHRFVQIVGPGGVGKTRLALELARSCVNDNVQDASWVDFQAVSSPDRIASAIASASRVRLGDSEGPEHLARALAKRRMLLVMDNCEHLAADIALVASSILAAAADVRIVATSQEVLRLTGSSVYRLGALALPPVGSSLAESRTFGSIQLLERRARAVDPRFTLSDQTNADTVCLCARLDGIPLALEMAAARLPFMGASALASHLDRHLGVLRTANVNAADRQQTLRATLEWSHALLSADERRLLRYLSAFVGTFRLEVAELVAAGMGFRDVEVVDLIAALVDKSLVQLESVQPPRYRLLETTRRFAQEELALNREQDEAWRLHGRAMAWLANEAQGVYWDWDIAQWLATYVPDDPDLQAAFDRALVRRDPEILAATGDVLRWLDFERDIETQARRRKEAALAMLPSARPPDRARMLSTLVGGFRFTIPAGMNRVQAARECVAAWAAVGNTRRQCAATYSLALDLAAVGQADEARRAIETASALANPQWPRRYLANMAQIEAGVAMYLRDERAVRSACKRIRRGGGNDSRTGIQPDFILARLSLVVGNENPVKLLLSLTDELRRIRKMRLLCFALGTLGSAWVKAGNFAHAHAAISESMSITWQISATSAVDHLALFASSTGHFSHSARLLGFNDAMFAHAQDGRQWPEAWAAEEAHARNVKALGDDEARHLRAEGSALDRAEAVALSQEVLSEPPR